MGRNLPHKKFSFALFGVVNVDSQKTRKKVMIKERTLSAMGKEKTEGAPHSPLRSQ
jgi:hypothetical protein